MKSLMLLLTVCWAGLPAAAQNTATPTRPAPAARTAPGMPPEPQPVAPNQNHVFPVQNQNPGGTAGAPLNNGLLPTNAFAGTNGPAITANLPVTLAELQQLLENLQVNIEQALPLLIAFTGESQISVTPGPVNPVAGAHNPTLAPTGNATPRRLANGAVMSSLGTNSYAMTPQTFERLRILSGELTRLHNQLLLLNGSLAAGGNAGNVGSGGSTGNAFTNLFHPLPPTLFPARQ